MVGTTNLLKIKAYETYLNHLFRLGRPRTFKSLITDINKLGKEESKQLTNSDLNNEEYVNECYKQYTEITGGIFEAFYLIFNYIFQKDPEIGLTHYQATTSSNDFGVDGIGVNANGIKCAVQIKFRTNVSDSITYEDICKTFTSGQIDFDIDTNKDNSVWLVTTGTPNYITTSKLGKRLKVIDRKMIGRKIDNNDSFWEEMWRLLQNTDELK